MENKKMNWGTLILGIIIGAAVVGIIWAASKPAEGGFGDAGDNNMRRAATNLGVCISGNDQTNCECLNNFGLQSGLTQFPQRDCTGASN